MSYNALPDMMLFSTILAPIVAWRKRHWLVFCTALAGLATLLLQPLAGSIFNIGQFDTNEAATATSERSLGLDPDRFQLTAFLAAAGVSLVFRPQFGLIRLLTRDFYLVRSGRC